MEFDIGGTNSMHGRDEKYIQFHMEIIKGRDHLDDLGVDGRITLNKMYLREIGCEHVDWINVAQDKVQWCVFVNTLITLSSTEVKNLLVS
jgi:hypothetical protein